MSDQASPDPDAERTPDYLEPPKAPVVQLPGTQRAPDPEPEPAQPRKRVDRERLEADYRAGLLTVIECGRKHGISKGRVCQIAKEHGWQRDVRPAARIKAAQILATQAKNANTPALTSPPKPASEAFSSEIDAVSAQMAVIRTAHRETILKGRVLLNGLLQEVTELAMGPTMMEFYELALAQTDPDERVATLRRAVERVTSMPSRIYGAKKLGDAAKSWITLERQAFDLDAPDDGKPPPPREKDVTAAEAYAWLAQQKPV